MHKKSGSALLLMIVVISLLTVLSVSILTVATSSHKTNIAYDNLIKYRAAAESGIEKALSAVNSSGIPVQIPAFTTEDGKITTTVTFKDNFNADNNQVDSSKCTIISTASLTSNINEPKKIIKVTLNKVVFNGGGSAIDIMREVIKSPLNVVGDFNKGVNIDLNSPPATFPAKAFSMAGGPLNVTGPVYMQGKYVESNSPISITGNVSMLANYIRLKNAFSFNSTASLIGKQKVWFDGQYAANILGAGYVQTDGVFDYNGIALNLNGNKLSVAASDGNIKPGGTNIEKVPARSNYEYRILPTMNMINGINYNASYTNDNVNNFRYDAINRGNVDGVSFVRMDSSNSNTVSFDVLDTKMGTPKDTSDNQGKMQGRIKILFVDGNYTIRNSAANTPIIAGNWIIYCTGTLRIMNGSAKVSLMNSSIYAKAVEIASPFDIDLMQDRFDDQYEPILRRYLSDYVYTVEGESMTFSIYKYME